MIFVSDFFLFYALLFYSRSTNRNFKVKAQRFFMSVVIIGFLQKRFFCSIIFVESFAQEHDVDKT